MFIVLPSRSELQTNALWMRWALMAYMAYSIWWWCYYMNQHWWDYTKKQLVELSWLFIFRKKNWRKKTNLKILSAAKIKIYPAIKDQTGSLWISKSLKAFERCFYKKFSKKNFFTKNPNQTYSKREQSEPVDKKSLSSIFASSIFLFFLRWRNEGKWRCSSN